MFLERLQSYGIDSSKYYKYGGEYNPVPSPKSDTALPNCTDYALCRTYEATEPSKPYPVATNGLGFPNAKYWYKQSPLAKGSELKVGSIACFDGQSGHVAYVERVIDKTHAIISQSQYTSNKSVRDYRYFETREVELIVGKATLNGVGALQGFIYTPINDIRVSRDFNSEQIEITQPMVNVRTKPNGEVYMNGCYCPMGIYNILSKQEDGEYVWYELEKNHWVRSGDWLIYYELSDIANLKKENEELKRRLKEIHNLSEV